MEKKKPLKPEDAFQKMGQDIAKGLYREDEDADEKKVKPKIEDEEEEGSAGEQGDNDEDECLRFLEEEVADEIDQATEEEHIDPQTQLVGNRKIITKKSKNERNERRGLDREIGGLEQVSAHDLDHQQNISRDALFDMQTGAHYGKLEQATEKAQDAIDVLLNVSEQKQLDSENPSLNSMGKTIQDRLLDNKLMGVSSALYRDNNQHENNLHSKQMRHDHHHSHVEQVQHKGGNSNERGR